MTLATAAGSAYGRLPAMGIVETLKDVVSVVQKADNLELMKGMLEVQSQAFALLEENHQLKAQNRTLSEQLSTQQSLLFNDGVYWGDNGDGPFCSPCWDARRVLVRVHQRDSGYPVCPNCDRVALNGQHNGIPHRPQRG
jgi:hypothetical protein